MWSTGILITSCIISFFLGEAVLLLVIGLFSANKEDNDNDNKQ